jgi:hypothetical protein
VEINEIDNRKTIKSKNLGFYENINKIDKILSRLIKINGILKLQKSEITKGTSI